MSITQPTLIDAAPRLVLLRIDRIEANPFQPRVTFSEAEMKDLASSIKEHGVLQPILARPKPGDFEDFVQIMDGERRFRAARDAGLETVPVLVRPATDRQMAELAIVANESRAPMSPIETARAYRRLIDEFGATAEEVAKKAGKSRPVISNSLRLLELPESVIQLIDEGALSDSHGRALAAYKDFPEFCALVAKSAAAMGTASKRLEGKDFPPMTQEDSAEAHRQKLFVSLGWDYKRIEEFKICSNCPFKARRDNGTYQSFCLKPEHHAELHEASLARIKLETTPNTPENAAKREKQKAEEATRQEKVAAENRKREFHKETLECNRELAQKELDGRRMYLLRSGAGIFEGLRREMAIIRSGWLLENHYAPGVAAALKRWGVKQGFDLELFASRDTSKEKRAEMLSDLPVVDQWCLQIEIELLRDTEDYWCKGDLVSAYIPAEDTPFPIL